MCLIAFAWHAHPRWRLLLLGNRDEFHVRPTAPLARWDEAPGIMAGRDLEAGGTWMGIAPHGRACVITNVRDPSADHSGASRGLLAADYLDASISAEDHAHELGATADRYRPFNFLTFDERSAFYLGNHPGTRGQAVLPGIHGLSNADFNAPWPKTQALKRRLTTWIADGGNDDTDALFAMLSDRERWPDDLLPDTGIGVERESFLSSAFIVGENYGTRASTIIMIDHDNRATIVERRFGPNGVPLGETRIDTDTASH
ncbi:uncharacterized protein with NRDE domain [Luteibacter rhizovicinus]|uniref:Uncharacterized protein with NRDE domain n=1 Tax=Luteibacter rhizovicinus TaxID=242606 RepID=A0A4R3YU55_9GAMM|nr:NRDE family protein [Luteibacter rhizovicinus]TCV96091.1 uncharacterized protein with NRDE domain [Luteibacter rhizovicinus]